MPTEQKKFATPNHDRVNKINEVILTKLVKLYDIRREEEMLVRDIDNLRNQISGVQLGQAVEAEAQVIRTSATLPKE